MGRFSGFLVTLRQMGKPRLTTQYPKVKHDKPERLHGRHVLNRYEDGMEKCIGCELCAGVCPARCIYVRGADNPIDDPVSPGRALRLRLRDQLPALHPLRPVRRGVPDRGDHRDEAVRVLVHEPQRRDLHEGTAPRRRRRPRPADAVGAVARRRGRPHERVDARDVAVGFGRRTKGRVNWSGELGFGVRPPEHGQHAARRRRAALDEQAGRLVEAVVFFVCAAAVAHRRARRHRRPQPGALRAVPAGHAGQHRGAVPPAARRARRRDPDRRLRERDRRAVPVRDHAARRRPARSARRRAPVATRRRDRARRARCSPASSCSCTATAGSRARTRRGARSARRRRATSRRSPRACSPTSSGRSR